MGKFGAKDTIWHCLAESAAFEMVICDAESLGKLKDEAIAWISLNRYLKFDASKQDTTRPCLATALLYSDRCRVGTSVQIAIWW